VVSNVSEKYIVLSSEIKKMEAVLYGRWLSMLRRNTLPYHQKFRRTCGPVSVYQISGVAYDLPKPEVSIFNLHHHGNFISFKLNLSKFIETQYI
jgi:hypothetical protein